MSPRGIPVPIPDSSVTIGGCLTAAELMTGAVPSTAVVLGGMVVIIGSPAHHEHNMKRGKGAGLRNR